MKRHAGEDTMLKLALGLLDTRAERNARRHLAACASCRGLLEEADRSLHQITAVMPELTVDLPLLPSIRHVRYTWLRVAAILIVGFGLGYFTSESLRAPSITVVRQQLVPMPPEWTGFVACDDIDVSGNSR